MKDKIINNFSKQHYKFYCWAKSIENTLKIIKKELIIDYKILLKELKTTSQDILKTSCFLLFMRSTV